jgi:hypothetical protein
LWLVYLKPPSGQVYGRIMFDGETPPHPVVHSRRLDPTTYGDLETGDRQLIDCLVERFPCPVSP